MIQEIFDGIAHGFHIPADLDDTSVNLVLGGMLSKMRDSFPSLYKQWEQANPNIPSLFQLETKVTYLS